MDCKAWKQKHASAAKSKSVALMQTLPKIKRCQFYHVSAISFHRHSESEERQIRILRDTGASHSFVLREMLPFSGESYTDTDVVVRGFGMGCVNVPLHHVYLKSDLVTGLITLGVCSKLPVDGVDLILVYEPSTV